MAIDAGSPPCSPQMPTLSFGRAARPSATAMCISRDDAASFLGPYAARGILETDPFVSIDRDGVGRLMGIAVGEGRAARPKLKVGICGEHGGDPASVAFCHEVGLDYVSCSPFRVPIARLAAAQAALGKDMVSEA